jgi:hypothetical protein
MDANQHGSQQLTLQDRFAESEAVASQLASEQRAYLVGALARVRASSDLKMFVAAVYRHTGHGGAGRWWAVRIRELCGLEAAPATQLDPLFEVLGCSESTAKRMVRQAREAGLVRTRPAGRSQPEQDCCGREPGEGWEYQIDWTGVKRLIGLPVGGSQSANVPDRFPVEIDIESGRNPGTRGQIDPGRGQIDPGRGQIDPGRGQIDPGSDAPIRNKYPVPVPYRVLSAQIPRTGTGTGEDCPRLLDGVTLGTLHDTGELLRLLSHICAIAPIKGLTDSPADQHWWLTAAECALRRGDKPVCLFRWLVQRNKRGVPTCPDGDRATKRLDQFREEQQCKAAVV